MVELEGIKVVYNMGQENEKEALKGSSLNINDGDFVVVVGPNGAGKSTMLKVILGEINPTEGEYRLNGKRMNGRKVHKIAHKVGRVYQDPNSGVFSNLSINENLKIASRKGMRGLTFTRYSEETLKLLEMLGLGLEKRMEAKAGELSGGQKQALAMVMSVSSKPEMLLLDEHTASLDPKSAKSVMELTKKINEELGMTVVMITHNMEFAKDYGNRLVQIIDGLVVEEAKNNTCEATKRLFV